MTAHGNPHRLGLAGSADFVGIVDVDGHRVPGGADEENHKRAVFPWDASGALTRPRSWDLRSPGELS